MCADYFTIFEHRCRGRDDSETADRQKDDQPQLVWNQGLVIVAIVIRKPRNNLQLDMIFII